MPDHSPLNVFLTCDVEIWCNGWKDLDQRFPDAFNRYIYGPTKEGDFGLEYQVKELERRNLIGNFFVEPLFSYRFGIKYLREIVRIIQSARQNVELHLHTEWVDEIYPPLIENSEHKRQHLRYYSLAEQTELIQAGKQQLLKAGVDDIRAFRAGSFALNQDTLTALNRNDIPIDSSYNHTQFGQSSGIKSPASSYHPFQAGSVIEYPMTVFKDGIGKMRHAQLTACSFSEIESALWQASEEGHDSFVFLFHNFELLNPAHTDSDPICRKRFIQLLDFLDHNRSHFTTRSFQDIEIKPSFTGSEPLKTSLWQTSQRYFEQLYRRRYQ